MIDIDVLIKFGQLFLTVAIGVLSFVTARMARSKADAKALDRRISEQDMRIASLEQQMVYLPSKVQLTELAGDMKALKVQMEGFGQQIGPLNENVTRINSYLLERK